MGYLLLAVALALNATANVLLKVGAARLGDPGAPDLIGRVLTNPQLVGGVVLFALNVVFYITALTRLNLSIAYPIMVAGGMVIVVGASVLQLREAVSAPQMLGLLLLVAGIVLVARHSSP